MKHFNHFFKVMPQIKGDIFNLDLTSFNFGEI